MASTGSHISGGPPKRIALGEDLQDADDNYEPYMVLAFGVFWYNALIVARSPFAAASCAGVWDIK